MYVANGTSDLTAGRPRRNGPDTPETRTGILILYTKDKQ
jgi:hypothetical protein